MNQLVKIWKFIEPMVIVPLVVIGFVLAAALGVKL